MNYVKSISFVTSHCIKTENNLKLSYLSIYWSFIIFDDPIAINFPFLSFEIYPAQTGLFIG